MLVSPAHVATHHVWLRLYVKEKICEQLDSALLTDDEMVLYNSKWASLPDPTHTGYNQDAPTTS